jgi:hypothetical protein
VVPSDNSQPDAPGNIELPPKPMGLRGWLIGGAVVFGLLFVGGRFLLAMASRLFESDFRTLADVLRDEGKHDEALAMLQEARSIVADFALPADAAWRRALQNWLHHARVLGNNDVAASLQAELDQSAASTTQAVTILEKFKVRPAGA